MQAALSRTLKATSLVTGMMILTTGCGAEDKTSLETEEKKLGYSIGTVFGERIQRDMEDLDKEAFMEGVVDGLEGNEKRLSEQEIQTSLQNFQKNQQDKQSAAGGGTADQGDNRKADAAGNLEKSEAFLKKNAARDAVKTTDSGLQYDVIEAGDGASPDADDRVTVHYTGSLIDDTVFDSSRKRGEPATFGLQQVIRGWTEGLQLMREGARYRFYIHPDLAYGSNAPQSIGPNQALIFDVELLEVK